MTIQFTSYEQIDAILDPFFDQYNNKFWELYSNEWEDQNQSRFNDAVNWAYRSISDTLEDDSRMPLVFNTVNEVYQYVIDAFKDQLVYAMSDEDIDEMFRS